MNVPPITMYSTLSIEWPSCLSYIKVYPCEHILKIYRYMCTCTMVYKTDQWSPIRVCSCLDELLTHNEGVYGNIHMYRMMVTLTMVETVLRYTYMYNYTHSPTLKVLHTIPLHDGDVHVHVCIHINQHSDVANPCSDLHVYRRFACQPFQCLQPDYYNASNSIRTSNTATLELLVFWLEQYWTSHKLGPPSGHEGICLTSSITGLLVSLTEFSTTCRWPEAKHVTTENTGLILLIQTLYTISCLPTCSRRCFACM